MEAEIKKFKENDNAPLKLARLLTVLGSNQKFKRGRNWKIK